MRVLVTGASGLLGGRLAEVLARHHEVVAGRHEAPPPAGLPEARIDLLSPSSLDAALRGHRPDAVVHCAAFADADACERAPDLAERLNVDAAEALARLCGSGGIRLVAVSTDLVFGGDRAFVSEDDAPRPLMAYARTKLAGEEAVLARDPGAAVLRVALVHGRGHGRRASASEQVAWGLGAGRPVRLFTDQYRTPVDPESVADLVDRLLRGARSGRFHAGGPERVSRHELGMRVARLLGLPSDLIEPVAQAEHPVGVNRPADVSLDSGRAWRELGWRPRALDEGLRESRLGPV